jgi:hypothetical protein
VVRRATFASSTKLCDMHVVHRRQPRAARDVGEGNSNQHGPNLQSGLPGRNLHKPCICVCLGRTFQ